MTDRPAVAILALAAICLLGFLYFPGHTYLHQDSQIYVPMMEHLADPSVLAGDLIATHPHLSFTVYDEIAVTVKRITDFGFQPILVVQQILARFLGLAGVYLLARAAGAGMSGALLAAGIFGLGTLVAGPSVLTVEFEPTPRAFALPVILFAAGLAVSGKWLAAGIAAAVAMLYHPPTVIPVLAPLAVGALGERRRRVFLYCVTAGAALLLLAAKFQAGVKLHQDLFSPVAPDVLALQHMRAAYVQVSSWWSGDWPRYALLFTVSMLAWVRIKPAKPELVHMLLGALPAIGLLGVAVSYVLYDRLELGLVPQLQPARAALWTVLASILTPAVAAARAVKWWERAAWLLIPFAAVVQPVPAILVLASAGAVSLHFRPWIPAAFVSVAMLTIPTALGVRNYPTIHNTDLDALSEWAKASTPKDAMFHFGPTWGKDLSPGIFRAKALRSVWVDWKGGGQVNFLELLAREWWRRWQGAPPEGRSIFVVHRGGCRNPVYQNARFCVEGQ